MLLSQIQGSDASYLASTVQTYWGGTVGTERHPKYGYGCDALPNGWAEIDWKEFAQSKFFQYTPKAIGWIRTTIGDAKLFYMHDQTGFALINDYWAGTVKVFRFGCAHAMESETIGNCLHRYTCTTCGFSEVVDSSD